MTATNPAHRHRDPVTVLFAAALDGDYDAEHELRGLDVHDDHPADALCALSCVNTSDITASPSSGDIAATDQVIAAVLELAGATAPRA